MGNKDLRARIVWDESESEHVLYLFPPHGEPHRYALIAPGDDGRLAALLVRGDVASSEASLSFCEALGEALRHMHGDERMRRRIQVRSVNKPSFDGSVFPSSEDILDDDDTGIRQ